MIEIGPPRCGLIARFTAAEMDNQRGGEGSIGAMPNDRVTATTIPLLHNAWRGITVRRHNGVSNILRGSTIEKVGQHTTADGDSA